MLLGSYVWRVLWHLSVALIYLCFIQHFCLIHSSIILLQPRATLRFPLGEVSLEEKEEEEEELSKRILSVNGILKGQILNGVCTAKYKDEALDLRYCFKVVSFSLLVHFAWTQLLLDCRCPVIYVFLGFFLGCSAVCDCLISFGI